MITMRPRAATRLAGALVPETADSFSGTRRRRVDTGGRGAVGADMLRDLPEGARGCPGRDPQSWAQVKSPHDEGQRWVRAVGSSSHHQWHRRGAMRVGSATAGRLRRLGEPSPRWSRGAALPVVPNAQCRRSDQGTDHRADQQPQPGQRDEQRGEASLPGTRRVAPVGSICPVPHTHPGPPDQRGPERLRSGALGAPSTASAASWRWGRSSKSAGSSLRYTAA